MMTQSTGPTSESLPGVRHPVDLDGIRKRVLVFEQHLVAKVAAARKNLIICNSLKAQSLELAAQTLVLEPQSPEVCRWLRIGGQAVAAIFEGAMATTDEIEVQLGDGPRARVPSHVTPDLHDVGNWTDGFFMAAICREADLLESLCRAPIELFRVSTTRGLEDSYLFAEALASHWSDGVGSAERALAALRATEETDRPAQTANATRELAVPEIQVFLRLIEKEAVPFNESLSRALELHRQFWSRDRETARDPLGYFSLSLTGLAALAHDARIPVTVESDYLPKGLVRGDCRPST
jgi:hypothetical protein